MGRELPQNDLMFLGQQTSATSATLSPLLNLSHLSTCLLHASTLLASPLPGPCDSQATCTCWLTHSLTYTQTPKPGMQTIVSLFIATTILPSLQIPHI